jgi:hypothetical protein
MTDNKPRPTSEADLGNRLAAANWHLVKLVAGALVRSIPAIPNPDSQSGNAQPPPSAPRVAIGERMQDAARPRPHARGDPENPEK